MPKFPINLGSYTTQELCDLNEQVVALIKERRRKESQMMKQQLSLGDRVMVPLSRAGKVCPQEGIVKKILRVEAEVEVNGRRYKLPMHMLSHAA